MDWFSLGAVGVVTLPPLVTTIAPLPVTLPPATLAQATGAQELLQRATTLANRNQYLQAIETLQQIPVSSQQWPEAKKRMGEYQTQLVNQLKPCADGSQPEALAKSSFYPVGKGQYVIQVFCFLAAYQGSYEFYLYTETGRSTRKKPLKLVQYTQDAGGNVVRFQSNQVGGLPDYNARTQELTIFSKIRGTGDCGLYGRYKFQKDELNLQEFRAKFECDGQYTSPSRWPRLYP